MSVNTAIMDIREKANIFIYRIAEKGLEIFLINSEAEKKYHLPSSELEQSDRLQKFVNQANGIELDQTTDSEGLTSSNVAMEADYHEIPSLKALLKNDLKLVKDKIYDAIPDAGKGKFVQFKEAFKSLLPHQYQALKELKEVVSEKNTTKFI